MRLRKSQLTFREIADLWARESAREPDAPNRDEVFHELLKALWDGEFEDEDGGKSCLTIGRPPKGGAVRVVDGKWVDEHHLRTDKSRPVTINRRWLLCALALDCPPGVSLPPRSRLRFWGPDECDSEPAPWSEVKQEVQWHVLKVLSPDEYSRGYRTAYLEKLTISKSDFRPVAACRWKELPRFWYGSEADHKAKSRASQLKKPAKRMHDRWVARAKDLTGGWRVKSLMILTIF